MAYLGTMRANRGIPEPADYIKAYCTPWFNGGHWVHYGVPGSPSESVLMIVPHEDATFNYEGAQ